MMELLINEYFMQIVLLISTSTNIYLLIFCHIFEC